MFKSVRLLLFCFSSLIISARFSLFQSRSASWTYSGGYVGFHHHFGNAIEAYTSFASRTTEVGPLNELSAREARLANTFARHNHHVSQALVTCKHLSRRKRHLWISLEARESKLFRAVDSRFSVLC